MTERLAAHATFARGEDGGERANFGGLDLGGVNLVGADLRGAGFESSNLEAANFGDADLRGANFSGANLGRAILSRANLVGADFRAANMRDARLVYSDLRSADLVEADLSGAFLMWSKLAGADLHRAKLWWARLRRADLASTRGLVILPIDDPRGFRAVAVARESHYMIASGCRWFHCEGARRHWASGRCGSRAIGDQYLRGLDWLEEQAPLDTRGGPIGLPGVDLAAVFLAALRIERPGLTDGAAVKLLDELGVDSALMPPAARGPTERLAGGASAG